MITELNVLLCTPFSARKASLTRKNVSLERHCRSGDTSDPYHHQKLIEQPDFVSSEDQAGCKKPQAAM
jgi:hypothetical protein